MLSTPAYLLPSIDHYCIDSLKRMLLPSIDNQNQKFVILFDSLFFFKKIEFDILEKPIRMMKYQLNVYQQCQLTQKKILKVFCL